MTDIPSAHSDDPHYLDRSGWLRAAVLGANDGIVSVSSLIVGVAAADPSPTVVAIAGLAGLTAGAMSMAAGEYVSVSSQSDIERADITRETEALENNPEAELQELVDILISRGMSATTAALAAREMTDHDAIGTHMRDELGLTDHLSANPLQAAIASGATFTVAAAIPLAAALLAPAAMIIPAVLVVTLLALALLGALGARAGAAPVVPAMTRVLVWGVFAMAITALVGRLFGVSV